MARRPWLLAELSYEEVKSNPPFEVAILPLGATEPHNLHLPYATDTLQVDAIAQEACALAHEAGARVVLLPTIPYGTETNMSRFPFAMNLNPTTVAQVVKDLVASLANHKIHKCLLLNGHGGNDLKWLLREMHETTPVKLFLCNWFRMCADVYSTIFSEPDDHAGEMETSLGLAHFPQLVTLDHADLGTKKPSRFAAVNRGWVEITRPWHLLTTNSGAGDPRLATAEKGRALTKVVAERLAGFLQELAAGEIDDSFPF